jgi:hypothetical protein
MIQNPWKIVRTAHHKTGERAIVDDMGFTICNPSPMGAQNAALISAAPDLLEALCMALPYVEDHEGSDIYKPQAVTAALAIIRAAIHKATDQTA